MAIRVTNQPEWMGASLDAGQLTACRAEIETAVLLRAKNRRGPPEGLSGYMIRLECAQEF